MHKKLTITLDEEVYRGLYAEIGERKISQFIENLVRPYVIHTELEAAYQEMVHNEIREAEADDWCEGVIRDINDEAR